jgi:daunorubicin C-13 ketoreductase
VVNTASAAHRTSRAVDPSEMTGDADSYRRLRAYGASKGANILFAAEATRLWPDILSTSFHPGAVRSNFGSGGRFQAVTDRLLPFLSTSPENGADTLVWLATAPRSEITPGGYYVRRDLRRPGRWATDPDLATRLWHASAAAAGVADEAPAGHEGSDARRGPEAAHS